MRRSGLSLSQHAPADPERRGRRAPHAHAASALAGQLSPHLPINRLASARPSGAGVTSVSLAQTQRALPVVGSSHLPRVVHQSIFSPRWLCGARPRGRLNGPLDDEEPGERPRLALVLGVPAHPLSTSSLATVACVMTELAGLKKANAIRSR